MPVFDAFGALEHGVGSFGDVGRWCSGAVAEPPDNEPASGDTKEETMPTSVLLAILAGAGLLALAPALVRRYDADERLAEDRENSSARVLERGGRDDDDATAEQSTSDEDEVDAASDGPEPSTAREATPGGWERCGTQQAKSVLLERSGRDEERRDMAVSQAQLRSWWRRRHRRVLFVLIAVSLLELLGVVLVGPGFWFGFAVSLGLLLAFVRYLRLRVVRHNHQQRPRTSALASERQVYVPPQVERDRAEPVSIDSKSDRDGADASTLEDSEPVPAEPTAPSRRRTGGIRGRSYESPANL